MARKAKKLIDRYFNQSLELKVQIYNLLAFVGVIAGTGVAAIAAALRDNILTVLIDFAVAVLSFTLLRAAEKFKCYRACSRIFVIVAFLIFFPVLFFACGGLAGGAAYSFVIAFVFTAILLEGRERNAALAFEFLVYLSCMVTAFYRPETAFALPAESDYLLVTVLNLATACTVILIVLLIRTRIFYSRQNRIDELNRELTARNETLAQYDSMKSDFLAAVAHEINTPLAIISASGSDTLDLLKETPLNMGEIVENQMESERMVKLIDSILLDLMDTAAIENGRVSLDRQPVNLAELLRTECGAQHKKLDANANAVVYELQPGLPEVWLDPLRIRQVVINLLANAFRHTHNGTVTVKLARTGDGRQEVSVSDDGEGMDAETARVALKQYVSTKADYWRHGIGLYICRRIVDAHGGEIRIESEKGRGTAVSFSLGESG